MAFRPYYKGSVGNYIFPFRNPSFAIAGSGSVIKMSGVEGFPNSNTGNFPMFKAETTTIYHYTDFASQPIGYREHVIGWDILNAVGLKTGDVLVWDLEKVVVADGARVQPYLRRYQRNGWILKATASIAYEPYIFHTADSYMNIGIQYTLKDGMAYYGICFWGENPGFFLPCSGAAWWWSAPDGGGLITPLSESWRPNLVTDPNQGDEEGEDNERGGEGDHQRIYDPVPFPTLPTIGVSAGGFVTPYCLTPAEMGTFGSNCFASDVWDAIKLYFEQPQDFIAGALLVPFTPPASVMYKPKFGAFLWPTPYAKLDSDFYILDCGEININEYYGSCFDYSPFTKLILWLPYIGYQELNADEVMGDRISIKYYIDCITGACLAVVGTGVVGQTGPQIPRVLGQYTGNCGIQVPCGKSSFDSAVSNAINILTTAIGVAAGAGAGTGIEANMANSGAKNAAMAAENHSLTRVAGEASQLGAAGMSIVSSLKPNTVRNGTPGSAAGFLGVQFPYLIKLIPRQALPSNYINLKGYPANIGGTLSQFSGYAEVSDIQLNNIPASVDEIEEIYDLLKGGILL